jgi:hypothetical protein
MIISLNIDNETLETLRAAGTRPSAQQAEILAQAFAQAFAVSQADAEDDYDDSMDGDHESALESVYGDNSGDFEPPDCDY